MVTLEERRRQGSGRHPLFLRSHSDSFRGGKGVVTRGGDGWYSASRAEQDGNRDKLSRQSRRVPSSLRGELGPGIGVYRDAQSLTSLGLGGGWDEG